MKFPTYHLESEYFVNETEEEENTSDEQDKLKKNKKSKRIFNLSYLSQLVNKKIYSDDFD